MTDPRIVFMGAPETDAAEVEARARADFPGIHLYCTNDRLDAQARAGSAEALTGQKRTSETIPFKGQSQIGHR